MAFMQPQIEFGDWIEVDGNCGTKVIPANLVTLPDTEDVAELFAAVRDYVESTRAFSISTKKGWGARLSAPGYMDCTEWTVFDTEEEAREYLRETYGDDEEEEETE